MTEYQLTKWKEVLWAEGASGVPIAFCPTHRLRLEVWDWKRSASYAQETVVTYPKHLICPEDNGVFPLFGNSFRVMARRYNNYKESLDLKHAKILDLDNIYTPVLKVEPKPKDKRFSVQVEVDTTKEGKKLVIYAADRDNLPEKTQIFIDPQLDKITFDGTGDIHPNMIFSKIVAYFKDGKSVTLEADGGVVPDSKS